MPVHLKGSCQCGAVEFEVDSHTPVPYQLCACSICRKVGGYSGSVNIGAINDSLKIVKGKEKITQYTAVKDRLTNPQPCSSQRSFCSICSAMLWVWDAQWGHLIHPFASAIDSELPVPKEMVCIMAGSKPEWVRWPEGKKVVKEQYNGLGIDEWHRERGLWVE